MNATLSIGIVFVSLVVGGALIGGRPAPARALAAPVSATELADAPEAGLGGDAALERMSVQSGPFALDGRAG